MILYRLSLLLCSKPCFWSVDDDLVHVWPVGVDGLPDKSAAAGGMGRLLSMVDNWWDPNIPDHRRLGVLGTHVFRRFGVRPSAQINSFCNRLYLMNGEALRTHGVQYSDGHESRYQKEDVEFEKVGRQR